MALLALLASVMSAVAGDTGAQDMVRSGSVVIEQTQIAFIGSGNLGGGKLSYGNRNYSFTIGGLGIGGFGISKMKAVGDVYNLKSVADFEGSYLQARQGFAVGDVSGGGLWLRNSKGVVLQLRAERSGLAVSLGGDAIYIQLD